MRASRNPRGGRTAPSRRSPRLCRAGATPVRPAAARTCAQKTAAAVDYILVHSERESMMRVPMRDGVRLSATILFPKDRPRQNLPTVLIFIPYLTEGTIRGGLFSGFIRSFIENGYAVIIENVRGRYFSEGTYTYLVGSGNDGYDTIDWISKQTWSNAKSAPSVAHRAPKSSTR
jgi:predicted acyl esterase